ncbi:MAG: patatin-like phospholipase RssA [Comamonadaceae bacterium]|nr:MAG: patatin-like phospholipase RssA [Comamonadaceae bacterium]
MASTRPRIGLALGSGSARGWAHLGVIRALERAGYPADVVCGTSVGALVGAAYAAGEAERLDEWVRSLTWQSVMGLMDFRMSGGLIQGARLVDFFRSRFADAGIEHLPKPFGCVATELTSGREVWLREGSVVDAVRASIALPGLLSPVALDERLLVDGGLVNPVPVSLCRALGADIVIAVDLNWDLIGRRSRVPDEVKNADGAVDNGVLEAILARFRQPRSEAAVTQIPSMLDVLTTSLNIMQVRITQSRLAGEPADVVIRPRLSGIAAMDFHRGAIAAAEGERAVDRALPAIADLLE